jgi:hypothetical protein
MSCFSCFKPEKKMKSKGMEAREVTVVKKHGASLKNSGKIIGGYPSYYS